MQKRNEELHKCTSSVPSMIVPLFPPLDGSLAERFPEFARALASAQQAGDRDRMQGILARELRWCEAARQLEDQRLVYEACIRILLDLVRLRWRLIEQGYGFALENPKELVSGRPTAEVIASKEVMRAELRPLVKDQLAHPAVRAFIERMERGTRDKKSIRLLFTNGAELSERLAEAALKKGDERATVLARVVNPVLEIADERKDELTGHSLREIWRYVRYTWSIPQVPTPGRQLLYLVRDHALSSKPVIGIASLNNCPLEMGETREAYIGWHRRALALRFAAARDAGVKTLETEVEWLEQQIETSLGEVEWKNLITADQIANPDGDVIRKLLRRGQEFARLREELLREVASGERADFDVTRWEMEEAPPVDDDVLKMEAKASVDARMHTARKQLIARKRAHAIGRLLQARLALRRHRPALVDPVRALDTLELEDVRSAINVILEALKARRAGANLLEITTCGAVPPYAGMLGGKLVALLMLSPQVGADYKRAYDSPSIISSQMRNQPVTRDSALVYLGTTSLYVHGSSQYNRLRIPPGTIAPDQPEIGYQPIGQTSGFGTVQFSPETSRAIDALLARANAYKEVNSVFGEGTSPKLRKLKMGLRMLGFDPDKLLQHRQRRLIYAAPLFDGAREWLMERSTDLPSYVAQPHVFVEATKRIADYWRSRWLASRLDHEPARKRLLTDTFHLLGDDLIDSGE